jgi:hypothetical protein
MGETTAEHKVTLRITEVTVRRAERLRSRAAKDPRAFGRITVSAILKRAIELGLDTLEREYAEK